MTPDQHHRIACRAHMLKRMEMRGLDLTAFQVFRIERRLHRARALFEVAGAERYRIGLLIGRKRFYVVYDARLRVLVTVLHSEPVRIRRRPARRGADDA